MHSTDEGTEGNEVKEGRRRLEGITRKKAEGLPKGHPAGLATLAAQPPACEHGGQEVWPNAV